MKACEGLVLIASIPNDSCAKHMVADTTFLDQVTNRLSSLYLALPKVMDPADVESVDAKWGSVDCVWYYYYYYIRDKKTMFLLLFMAALCNRAGHYIFALWFRLLSSIFFSRLISAVADWMSTILPHMVWP